MSKEQSETPVSGASKLFDLRVLIGGLFTFYGVVLTIAGLVASEAAKTKASGININLWMGLGMLTVGLLFLLWWRLRPLHHDLPPSD
jgi:xanthine/uracil/vitamin C permease (AzgA family)